MRRWYPAAALLVAGVLAPVPAFAAPAVRNCAPAGEALAPVPWAQQMLDPERAWPLSTGRGVVVAVLDSGVDAAQPQLRGHVQPGADLIEPAAKGDTDCIGHGTQVAGIIAAQRSDAVGFHGFAPGVSILPVRVSEEEDTPNGPSGASAGGAGLASAITFAVAHGARVVNISLVLSDDNPAVHAAVDSAIAQGVVIVAAAGNHGDANEGNLTPYPAAYKGVIGVGAVDEHGTRWQHSQHGPYVDVVAPGAGVVTTQRGGGLVVRDGTSYATAFVSATVALVRGRFPTLSPSAVARRLEATATPAAGGPDDPSYGHGIVNPYAALTEDMPAGERPHALPALGGGPDDTAARARAASWARSRDVALLVVAAVLVVALVLLVTSGTLARGRRRRWRPGLAAPIRDRPEDDRPAPPVHLFEDR
jgi:membrane-anchored mycosin MYCP